MRAHCARESMDGLWFFSLFFLFLFSRSLTRSLSLSLPLSVCFLLCLRLPPPHSTQRQSTPRSSSSSSSSSKRKKTSRSKKSTKKSKRASPTLVSITPSVTDLKNGTYRIESTIDEVVCMMVVSLMRRRAIRMYLPGNPFRSLRSHPSSARCVDRENTS
jgi:hypothetical protein